MSDGGFRPGFRITEHQPDAARDARDEIAFHLAMRERELRAQGMSESEAKAAALASFGDAEAVRAALAQIDVSRRGPRAALRFLESVAGDIRFGLRGLRRSPVFASMAIVTLALGIGANAVIFSLIEAALLRAPAVRDADRMVAVWTTSRLGQPRASSSLPDFEDYRDRSTRIEGLAAYSPLSLTAGGEGAAELVGAEAVSGNYFDVLGLRAAAGRLLTAADDAAGADANVAVLSHAFWRSRYGGDRSAIGRTLLLNGVPHRIAGVAPRGYDGLVLGQVPDLWVPLRALPGLFPTSFTPARLESRTNRWIGGLAGRLADGATLEQARADLLRVSDQLFAEDSLARGPRRVTVDALPRRILPGGDAVGPFLAMLQGVVALTLLLACANLANLLLARATARRTEMAIRLALGVDRARLARQLLTESVLLAMLGGALGLGLAQLTLRAVAGLELPFGMMLDSVGASLNVGVILFTLLLTLGTGLLFGTVPAAGVRHTTVASVLRETRGGETGRSLRLRAMLIAVQLAVAVVLLAGAGLFVQTLRNRLAYDLGFPVRGLAMLSVDPSMNRYSPERTNALVNDLIARVTALPGVASVSAGAFVPVEGGGMGMFVEVDGYQPRTDEEMRLEFNLVAPDFLRTLGLPLVAGREIGAADVQSRAAVIVIDETMAERWFSGRNAVGGMVRVRSPEGSVPFTVIGVMKRSAWGGIELGSEPYALLPAGALPGLPAGFARATTLLARTQGDAASVLPSMRRALHELDPGVAVMRARTMNQELGARLAGQRAAVWLLSSFAALALILATVGIFGVLSYVVAQRERDLSLRIALGARIAEIVRLVAGSLALPCLLGLTAGVASARALAGTIDRFMFGVTTSDPSAYLLAAAVLALAMVTAALVPVLRAARIPPARLMRQE
jgi:predicted permease